MHVTQHAMQDAHDSKNGHCAAAKIELPMKAKHGKVVCTFCIVLCYLARSKRTSKIREGTFVRAESNADHNLNLQSNPAFNSVRTP